MRRVSGVQAWESRAVGQASRRLLFFILCPDNFIVIESTRFNHVKFDDLKIGRQVKIPRRNQGRVGTTEDETRRTTVGPREKLAKERRRLRHGETVTRDLRDDRKTDLVKGCGKYTGTDHLGGQAAAEL